MIKAAIFDLDGTAADTVESLAWSANVCLRQMGLPEQPTENFNYYAGDGARVMLTRCLKDAGDPEGSRLEEMLSYYWDVFKEGCTVGVQSYPGLPKVLQAMKEKGLKLAICSNKAQLYSQLVVEKVYGKELFDQVMRERPDHARKPSPEGPLMIAGDFCVSPEECLYIGDTNTDMQTGLNAGMKTVGVTWGFRTRQELEESGAQVIIDRAEEILDLL
jgi:phosphoglycolate phosphatase